MGLGLFIVKNIVEQHQGSIKVESSGIRTVFTVRLPIKDKFYIFTLPEILMSFSNYFYGSS